MKKIGICGFVGLVLLGLIMLTKPAGEVKSSNFTQILHGWGDRQEEISEDISTKAVANAEGKYVGFHEKNGSNWSIPSILRHVLGVE